MKRLTIDVEDDLYKRMYSKIQELSDGGSTYGKGRAFIMFAIEHLLGELNGNTEVAKQLKKTLAPG